MQIFEKLITVTKDDLDQLNHVNNVRYVQWVQDVAEAHWLKNATKDILDSYYWVLLSHHIDYKSSAVEDDTLKVITYVKKAEGVTSTRIVEMYNQATNKIIVKSETNWCLMSAENQRPARITTKIIELFQ